MEQLVVQKKNAISGSMDNSYYNFKQSAHYRNRIRRRQ
jgi:hypothetical protein